MTSLGAWLAGFWLDVAVHLWQTSLILGVIFVLARAMRFAPARGAQALWSAALLKILLPVSILWPSIAWLAQGPGASRGAGGPMLEPVRAVLNPARLFAPEALAAGRWVAVLALGFTVVWVAVFSMRLRNLILDCARAARDRGAPIERLPRWSRTLVDAALAGTAIPPRVIRVSHDAPLPYVAGLIRPRILVPSELIRAVDASQLRALLLHEDAHRRRRDPLRAAGMRLCAALLFFYPPVAYVMRRLRESAELICDEHALRSGLDRAGYAGVLANALRRSLVAIGDPLSAGLGGGPGLRARFDRISCPRRYSMMNRHRLVLGGIFCLLAAAAFLPAPLLAGDDGKSPASSEEVYPELDKMPVLVKTVPPVYPEAERKAGVEGTVILKMRVTAKGTAAQILVAEGVKDHPAFNDSAINAAREWLFEPGEKDGKPVACWVSVPVRFALK